MGAELDKYLESIRQEPMYKDAMRLAELLAGQPELSACTCSIAVPGHPHDGHDVFYQKDRGGPFMTVVTCGSVRTHLWRGQGRRYYVRHWANIGDSSLTSEFETEDDAVVFLLANRPRSSQGHGAGGVPQ